MNGRRRCAPGVTGRRRVAAIICVLAFQGCAAAHHFDASGAKGSAGAAQPAGLEDGAVLLAGARGRTCCEMVAGTARQKALRQAAGGFVGRTAIKAAGRRFTYDCSGLVRGVYVTQGIDVYDGLGELDGGNGVGRIYGHVVEHGRVHYGPTVHPGDLVFFHNTWDFNRDGRLNDPLTHVGVVERVEHDGTVIFVSLVSGGVERFRMNLRKPDTHRTGDGRVLNDYLRRRSARDPNGTPHLTGQLFAAFGTLVTE